MDKTVSRHRVTNRRPLVLLAVFFASGVVLGRFAPMPWVYGTAAAVMAAAAVCRWLLSRNRPRRRLGVGAIWLAGAACAMLASFLASAAMTVEDVPTGEGLRVTGHIYSEPYQNDYDSTVCLLDDASVDGQPCGNIKLYVDDGAGLKCGDVVSAAAEVERPKGVRNPGGFDEKLYLLAGGVHFKAYADTAETTGYKVSFEVAMVRARRYISDTIDRVFEADIAPVAKGLLLGDKQGLDEQTYTDFKDTGLAHVLAVSGLHAGILIAAAYFFFRKLRMGRTPRLAATLVFIAAYACVTGLAPSILRASVMAAVLLLHRHFGRQADTLNGLALAFIVSLLLNPLDLFMAGFQLSFGAVFGILTLGWQLRRMMRGGPAILSKPADALAVSAGATAGTLPILAASFNRISLFGVLLNVVMIPLASVIIVLVFICTFLGMAAMPAAAFLAYMPAVLIRLLLAGVGWAADIPFMAVDVASPPWYMVLAFFGILFITSKYMLVRVRLKTIVSAALAAAVLAVLVISRPAGMYLVFLDVGQGDAAFIRTEQGGEYFIDGGRPESAEEVVSFTVRTGATPDAAFVSHTDDDHFAGITALYEAGLLDKVYCSYQEERTVEDAMPDAEVVPLAAGDVVLLDDKTRAVVLYPYRNTAAESANDMSLVLLVQYDGHDALFTGDISGETETYVLTGVGHVDIYKAAHHGSKYSSYRLPLSALTPEYSVVSVGDNSFGQPHEWALRNLEDYSDQVFVTEDDYAVEFYIRDGITVHAYGEKYGG